MRRCSQGPRRAEGPRAAMAKLTGHGGDGTSWGRGGAIQGFFEGALGRRHSRIGNGCRRGFDGERHKPLFAYGRDGLPFGVSLHQAAHGFTLRGNGLVAKIRHETLSGKGPPHGVEAPFQQMLLFVATAQHADSGYGRHAEEQDQKIIRRRGADGAAAAASAIVLLGLVRLVGAAVGRHGAGGGHQRHRGQRSRRRSGRRQRWRRCP